MFGTANQLLAGVALAVVTAALINAGKVRYLWVTLIPLVFVAVTTLYAGWCNIFGNFMPLVKTPGKAVLGCINIVLSAIIMVCAAVVLVESIRRCYRVLVLGKYTRGGKTVSASDPQFRPPEFGEA
jgi:carbon starvation protein